MISSANRDLASEPFKRFSSKNASTATYSDYTIPALEDELLKSFLSSEKNKRFYYAQAEYFIRRINIYDPLPVFVLHTEDIPKGLTKELSACSKVARNQIITNVVRRIYESVDPDYFSVNGIYAKVKWFMLEDTT